MVLNHPAPGIKLLWFAPFILGFAIYLYSCNDGYIIETDDCSECLGFEPYEADLYIKVSLGDENRNVPVVVLRGKLENHDTLLADTISKKTGYIRVPLDQYYTVVATYYSGNTIIKAVDGDEIKKINISNICGDICWVVKGGIINVTINR
ncbi:MAG: hypothetical protein DRI73_01395 [Bacteroidetes bacterium]|nr:MAG: hypothetical protein DRI73_01395 [Bacteroidota bacterium]